MKLFLLCVLTFLFSIIALAQDTSTLISDENVLQLDILYSFSPSLEDASENRLQKAIFSQDDTLLITLMQAASTLQLWDIEQEALTSQYVAQSGFIYDYLLSPDNTKVVLITSDDKIEVVSFPEMKWLYSLDAVPGNIQLTNEFIVYHMFVQDYSENAITLWNIETGEVVVEKRIGYSIYKIQMSPSLDEVMAFVRDIGEALSYKIVPISIPELSLSGSILETSFKAMGNDSGKPETLAYTPYKSWIVIAVENEESKFGMLWNRESNNGIRLRAFDYKYLFSNGFARYMPDTNLDPTGAMLRTTEGAFRAMGRLPFLDVNDDEDILLELSPDSTVALVFTQGDPFKMTFYGVLSDTGFYITGGGYGKFGNTGRYAIVYSVFDKEIVIVGVSNTGN